MTFYIMIENDELSWKECLKESKKITKGNMRKIFLFELSFIGWFLLSVLTLGALFFYVLPYYKTAHANLYLTLKENQKMSKEGLL